MAEESKLRVGEIYQLTEDLERELRYGGGSVTYKVFPAGTTHVRIIQIRPWIQVEVIDEDSNPTGEQFAVLLHHIDDIRAELPDLVAN